MYNLLHLLRYGHRYQRIAVSSGKYDSIARRSMGFRITCRTCEPHRKEIR